jgi:hypothetical protein
MVDTGMARSAWRAVSDTQTRGVQHGKIVGLIARREGLHLKARIDRADR